MKLGKAVIVGLVALMVYACTHPLEIGGKGEGDILSLTGNRDCLYEQSRAGDPACTDNAVSGEAYVETFTAVPRPGSQFRRWVNYCTARPDNTCPFNVEQRFVDAVAGTTAPPLVAVFRPVANTGLNALFIGDNQTDALGAGVEAHALAAGFGDHTTTRFAADGDDGAPQALWDDPASRAAIQAVLDGGDVDVLGMTWSDAYPGLDGYRSWIDYALAKNWDTRFFITTPPGSYFPGTTFAQFETFYELNEAAVHALVDALRAEYPGVDIYALPSGRAAVDLYGMYFAGELNDDLDVLISLDNSESAVFQDFYGTPGDILAELGGLVWFASIYGSDLAGLPYAPLFNADLVAAADALVDAHPLAYAAPPHAYPDADGDGVPDRFDPISLRDLLANTTRGVFQVEPRSEGALAGSNMTASWHPGPLQVLERYGAGLDLAAKASRILIAQPADAPQDVLLLATLAGTSAELLLDGIAPTPAPAYLGYSLLALPGGHLQLAIVNDVNIAIGPRAALESALDVYEGFKPDVTGSPIAGELLALDAGQPNSFVYGLPALYGATPAPGSGAVSLSQARVVNGAFSVVDGELAGALNFFSDNAMDYTARVTSLLAGLDAPSFFGFPSIVSVNLAGLSVADDVLPLLKTLVYEMDAVDYTDAVGNGGNEPWLNFNVGEDPNSIFINFEFSGAQARTDFEDNHLPDGFTLAQVKILDTDEPTYFLVLNIYQSSGGLVEGARAEWSVFVNDPDTGEPRFLVVEAVAETISADSVNLLTFPEPVDHVLTGSSIDSYVGIVDESTQVETTYFSSSLVWPQFPEMLVNFAPEFAVTNDYIFWGNAVADRTLYNNRQHNRPAVQIPDADLDFVDNSIWADFVNPEPVHTVVYKSALEIVISPWWNLGAPYLDVTPQYLQTLLNFKNGFYPATVQGVASSAIKGDAVILNPAVTGDSVPTAHYHFPVTDIAGLMGAIGGGFTPVSLTLFDGESAGHYLSLAVYQREDDPCGLRAEWRTYVQGLESRPTALRLDTLTSEACLDPAVLLNPAAAISQGETAGYLETVIDSPFIRFDASVNLALTAPAVAGQDLVETEGWLCSLNGACDKGYYDGALLTTPADLADTPAVTLSNMQTPWDDYIDTAAVRTSVRDTPALRAFNLWRNVRSFAGSAPVP